MKLSKKKVLNVWNICFIYVYLVSFSQILESFLPFSFTKIFAVYLIGMIAMGVVLGRIRARPFFFILAAAMAAYVAVYFRDSRVFNYAYSGAIVLIIAELLAENTKSIHRGPGRATVNRVVLAYSLLNLLMYLTRRPAFFQMNQFKGALPHTNMLGSLLTSEFILIMWHRTRLGLLNRVLITLLVLVSMSRTYILMILLLWLVILATYVWKDAKFWVKALVGGGFLLIAGMNILNVLAAYIPSLIRFRQLQFSGTGREWLISYYASAFGKSSVKDIALGVPVVGRYLKNIAISFNHSFAENSIVSIAMLFGLAGVGAALWLTWRQLRDSRSSQSVVVFLLLVVSLLTQDTLLSVQTGILFALSLKVNSQAPIPIRLKGRPAGHSLLLTGSVE